jgi:calcineurin-like phosphoesterase family protein
MHFGHRNIQKFRLFVSSEEDNRKQIIDDWNKWVTKRDLVYVMGDSCFSPEYLDDIRKLPGRKILIKGNHDKLTTTEYLTVFDEVHGIIKYKEFWLSHAPIHPLELRGKYNIHGHVHYHSVPDSRYFNTSVENINSLTGNRLISLSEIRKYMTSWNS